MALANVGAYLARSKRRVLLVDFDLEAPGIDTFKSFEPSSAHPGIVDYICHFLETGEPAQVSDYLYEIPEYSEDGGCLWVMPAGTRDKNYSRRLASINWEMLYREMDGFLFVEDMKAQWREQLNPRQGGKIGWQRLD